MYEDQTEAIIKQRMISNAPTDVNTSEGDFFNDAVSPATIEFALAYQMLDRVLSLGFADTSYGAYLDKITSQNGIDRKVAVKGTGKLEVTMTPGSVIKIGDVFATKYKNIRFVSLEAVTISDTGTATINIENESAGNYGNILVDTVFVTPTSISGFISARNPALISAGTDCETDEVLRERYLEKVQAPETAGNKSQYVTWAKGFAGVGDAKVFPLWNGSNTVKILIIDSNKQPASQSLVDEVQKYIDPGSKGCGEGQAPIGAVCTVESAIATNIKVSASITGATVDVVKPLFETALTDYFKELAFSDTSVSYTKIGSILLDCVSNAGGKDCSSLLVNDGTANIQLIESITNDNTTIDYPTIPVKGVVTLV